jgi:hypothetical protein
MASSFRNTLPVFSTAFELRGADLQVFFTHEKKFVCKKNFWGENFFFFEIKCSNIEVIWTLDAFLQHMESFLNI